MFADVVERARKRWWKTLKTWAMRWEEGKWKSVEAQQNINENDSCGKAQLRDRQLTTATKFKYLVSSVQSDRKAWPRWREESLLSEIDQKELGL